MGLQDMIRRLLPREDVFYDLLERQTVLLVEAARALVRFADGAPAPEVHEAVRALEQRADEVEGEVEDQLARIFVTPIDREDIQRLASAIDDIVDDVNLIARTLVLFGVPAATPAMAEMMRLLVVLAELLQAELPALRRHQYAELIALGRVIKDHEKRGDSVFRGALSELFRDPAIDVKRLLRDKEVLVNLEGAIDGFETVGERLKNLAVKHG